MRSFLNKELDFKFIMLDTLLFLFFTNMWINSYAISSIRYLCSVYVTLFAIVGEFFISVIYSLVAKIQVKKMEKILVFDIFYVYIFFLIVGEEYVDFALKYIELQVLGIILGYILNKIDGNKQQKQNQLEENGENYKEDI